MRKCRQCHDVRHSDQFFKSPYANDERLGLCIPCVRKNNQLPDPGGATTTAREVNWQRAISRVTYTEMEDGRMWPTPAVVGSGKPAKTARRKVAS